MSSRTKKLSIPVPSLSLFSQNAIKNIQALSPILLVNFVCLAILGFTVGLRPNTNQFYGINTFAQDMIVYFQSNVIQILVYLTPLIVLLTNRFINPFVFIVFAAVLYAIGYLFKAGIQTSNVENAWMDEIGQVIGYNYPNLNTYTWNKATAYRYDAYLVFRASSFTCTAIGLITIVIYYFKDILPLYSLFV